MSKLGAENLTVRVYHGYGHTHNLVVYGHVLRNSIPARNRYTDHVSVNIMHLLRLFMVKPAPAVKIALQWRGQLLYATSESDGFFKFEWKSETSVEAGWHEVIVSVVDESGRLLTPAKGKIFVPHVTQYGFISDIDDTVLVSHSATIIKRLVELFTKNPRTRSAFRDVVLHYELLSGASTTTDLPNPFFYVSSSEWNLYDELNEFFSFNKLPNGTFLLSQMKQWFQLLKTGKTSHEGKLLRVFRILDAFPKQQFILLGDNSQKDPFIYSSIANKYPEKIFAIYIRNIKASNEATTEAVLSPLKEKGIHTCQFKHNNEAIEHSKHIGLITVS